MKEIEAWAERLHGMFIPIRVYEYSSALADYSKPVEFYRHWEVSAGEGESAEVEE